MTISEWLPNPTGSDSAEWVEIFNPGPAASLAGWKLKTANGRSYSLYGQIGQGEYRVFQKSALRFTLRNTDESLTLLSPLGKVADASAFPGTAPEGKSILHQGETSFLGVPTPGAVNAVAAVEIIRTDHPYGVPLGHNVSALSFWGGMLGTAITLTALVIYFFKTDAYLSELFFGKY